MPDCLPSARLNAVSIAKNIPLAVTAELTRRCPLSCRHCYLPETRGRARPGRELTTRQWGRVLEKLAGAGGLYLVFTGGEPLLRADLAELCRRAKGLRFDVRVFTSGHGLTAPLARELAGAGVSVFELSFYGRPAAHDAVTGAGGSFRRTLAAARLLRAAGAAVKMKVPLMSLNSGQAGWLRRLAGRERFGISFDAVIAPANDGDRSALRLRPPASAVRRLAQVPAGRTAPAEPGPDDLLCGAGRNVCAVDPAGNLYPCLQLPVRLGNLARSSFRSLWRNAGWLKSWRALAVKDLAGCAGCRDAAWCSRCPGISLLEEGDALAPNAPACSQARALRAAYKKSRP